MIFKQVEEILNGTKTQTRPVCNLIEMGVHYPGISPIDEPFANNTVHVNGRIKWQVGRTYAVVPKWGARAVWWRRFPGGEIQTTVDPDCPESIRRYDDAMLKHDGWQPLRIEITAIRRERVNEISEEDARAEGYPYEWPYNAFDPHLVKIPPCPVFWYRELWDSINKRKGIRFSDAPLCWVIEFRVAE